MGIKTQSIYASRLSSDVSRRREPINQIVDEKDPFSWMASAQLDLLLWPTINISVDIDQKADIFVILGTLNLPKNTIELKDEYQFVVSVLLRE